MARYPVVAGTFYPADELAARRQVQQALRQARAVSLPRPLRAGVVPHAGWVFSGATAAYVFAALAAQCPAPETIVLFGAVHRWGVTGPSVYPAGSWRTPLGDLYVDQELAEALLKVGQGLFQRAPEAHADEHSIEVQLPFIKHVLPDATILPIAVLPDSKAPAVGRLAAQAAQEQGRLAVAIGSSDLTHYGPRYGLAPAGIGQPALDWTHENDRRIIELMVQMRPDDVLREAQRHHNACGAGAIAAAIAFAQTLGAQEGILLHYTTSHEVM
ncbi:MAG: AmmeMemoRadiSam system protein B, partial [Chloroflexi bacterium]|nr:AmmeMemoRadiSam system protein B [Chloroflexota bacterium]